MQECGITFVRIHGRLRWLQRFVLALTTDEACTLFRDVLQKSEMSVLVLCGLPEQTE